MGLILDTGAVIRLAEERRPDVIDLIRAERGRFSYALATLAELHRGVASSTDEIAHTARGDTLRLALTRGQLLLPDTGTASKWGELAAATPRRVVHNDLWIAATALQHALTLVTFDSDLAAAVRQRNAPVILFSV